MIRDFDRAANDLRKFKGRLENEIDKAETQTAREGLKKAVQQSSGRITTAQLRREDHPYAKRHKKAKRDPGIINSQTGEFKSEWHVEKGRTIENGPAIVNFSRKAGWLQAGTRTMVARPIEKAVIDHLIKVRPINLDRAIEKASR